GISDGCTSDHNAIDFIFHTPGGCFFHRVYVSISKNRDLNTRITFYIPYHTPVGLPLIHLGSCASVDGQCFDAHILKAFRYFVYIFSVRSEERRVGKECRLWWMQYELQ